MRRLTLPLTVLALGLVPAAAVAETPAQTPLDDATREASCSTLYGGTVNDVDAVPFRQIAEAGSLDQWPAAPAGLLPARVWLRGTQETFNARYAFATRDGQVYASPVDGGAPGWHKLPLPDCFAGRVTAISADDDELVAIDRERRIFTMDNALKGPDLFNWTRRWGPPLWLGKGRTLPGRVLTWSWSVLSPAEDVTWTDVGGHKHPVGEKKVSHIWALRDGGRRLTFMDPWLPADDSYEMCGPHRSRFRSAGMSASGSTVFVIGRDGDMFTRLYDFDLAGHDAAFLRYTYGNGGDGVIQLPAPPWVRQPKVPGAVTSAISIEKRGVGAIHQTLRVEGLDRRGRTGYWEKDSTARKASAWRFHVTGQPLRGRRLRNPQRDTSAVGLGRATAVDFAGEVGGVRVQVRGFDVHCSPATLLLSVGRAKPVRLRLHSADGLRQTPRAAGLDSEPRALYGVVEVPPAALRGAPARVVRLVRRVAGTRRYTDVGLSATARSLTFAEPGWSLTR